MCLAEYGVHSPPTFPIATYQLQKLVFLLKNNSETNDKVKVKV